MEQRLGRASGHLRQEQVQAHARKVVSDRPGWAQLGGRQHLLLLVVSPHQDFLA